MDALDRIEPVARDLLRTVDDTLAGLGAPADHPVWDLLRRIGATPAGAVAFFGGVRPDRLRSRADAVRGQADAYRTAELPTATSWLGGAGAAFTVRAAALAEHLRGDGPDSLLGRVLDTAAYLDEVADWQQRSRNRIAHAMADVLTSGQAVTLRLGVGPAVSAAADIGACVLTAADEAQAEGAGIAHAWTTRLTELSYVDASIDQSTHHTIEVHH